MAAEVTRGASPPGAPAAGPFPTRGGAAAQGHPTLSTGGAPLSAATRAFYEPRFGQSLADVRVHAGPTASLYAGAVKAQAFSYGDHIWMGAGQRAQPSPLLAHELAHVAQQRASGQRLIARKPDPNAPADDPDRNVKLPGIDDSPLLQGIASQVLGEGEFIVLRELLRGMVGGAEAAPPEQLARIHTKFSSMGPGDAASFGLGFVEGVGLGLWSSITGLFEAVFTLIKLPYDVEQFLVVKLPALATKYGPRLLQLAGEGDQIAGEIRQAVSDLLKDPANAARELGKLVEGIKDLALEKVRALGHEATSQFLSFLGEDWPVFGKDLGKLAGMVLFEVLLALGTDLIGNVAKEAAEVGGRLAARVLGSAAELFASIRRFLGSALQAIERLGSRLAGKLAELLERLKSVLRRLARLFEELLGDPGLATETGTGLRIPLPEPKGSVLESRSLKPHGGSGPKVGELKPPKFHPSKAELAPEPSGASRKTVTSAGVHVVPSVKNGAFAKWFNELPADEFDRLWANPEIRDTIEDRLRSPGGMHEWHLVARANVFKRWGVTAEQIKELRTATSGVEFVNPIGRHGGRGSAIAHNELLELIDSSKTYAEFRGRLRVWAASRLRGGIAALPSGLQSD